MNENKAALSKHQNSKRRKPQGRSSTDVRNEITRLYQKAANGIELASLLKEKHYALVRSTRKTAFVLDPQGGEHNLFARINAPREAIAGKLADLNIADLPLKNTRERTVYIKCFLTPAEKAKIKTFADHAELTVSGYIRMRVFGNQTRQPKASRRPLPEKDALVKLRQELRQIGGQLQKVAESKSADSVFDYAAYTAVCQQHSIVLKAIMTALGKDPA